MRFVLIAFLCASTIFGCRIAPDYRLKVTELSLDAQRPSGQPSITTSADGTVFASWVERPQNEAASVLRLARLEADEWRPLPSIASGPDWFVNWADTPSVIALSDSILFAHFLQKSSPDTYAYHVMVTQSTDGGSTWAPPQRLHSDSSDTEHGFVSLVPRGDSTVVAVWLDGRETASGLHHNSNQGAMTLRSAAIRTDGSIGQRLLIDERVCDCCQTAATSDGSAIVAVYRDRSGSEIRDIFASRLDDEEWAAPAPVHNDGWKIAGCPVNGPSISAGPEALGVAWFTAANDEPRVQASFSEDKGVSFGEAVRIDHGSPLGRVAVAALHDGTFSIAWLEDEGDKAAVRVTLLDPKGTELASTTVAETGNGRASGFPRIAVSGRDLIVTWTDTLDEENAVVRTARVEFH